MLKGLNIVILIMFITGLVVMTQEPHLYEVGECFRWKHNHDYGGTITETTPFIYRYRSTNGKLLFTRKYMLEKQAEKITCI